ATGVGVQGQAFGDGIAVVGKGGRLAGRFEGNVEVTDKLLANGGIEVSGNINVTSAGDIIFADCAEDFNIAQLGSVEPGTVMVIGDDGDLRPSFEAYDKRVAG